MGKVKPSKDLVDLCDNEESDPATLSLDDESLFITLEASGDYAGFYFGTEIEDRATMVSWLRKAADYIESLELKKGEE